MRSKLAAVVLGAAAVVCAAAPAQAAKPKPPPPSPTYSYAQCQTAAGSAGTVTLCVEVAPTGTANPDGSATVPVTVTCTATTPDEVYYGNVRVWQDAVGPAPKTDQVLVGSSYDPVPCDGTADVYPVTTAPRGYHPGSARVIAQFSAQGSSGLTTVQVDTGDYQTTPATAGVVLA